MTDEKGYIQFRCEWERASAPAGPLVAELIEVRNHLRGLGLIGVYPNGIGFGNVSARLTGHGFVISGTATGGVQSAGPEHFTEVVWADVAANALGCRGPVAASSESLSHAAVYGAEPAAGTVIHVHHLRMWEELRGALPTTDPQAEAGTPAMADAIAVLLRAGVPDGLFVMGGHREGLMAFGRTTIEACERLLTAWSRTASAGRGHAAPHSP
ncbi:MAG: class II aldolase/adducin family protein [Planctomycetes bacterium]|nr:class II aldolase/adducin family protein [Planctomycetota bacterium]